MYATEFAGIEAHLFMKLSVFDIRRDECISYYLPDNQWHQVQKNSKNLDRLRILIDFAVVVREEVKPLLFCELHGSDVTI